MRREEDRRRESMLEYLAGAVAPEELERLNRAVETDPAARRELAELILQETLLFRVGQESRFFELDVPGRRPSHSSTTSRILKIRIKQASTRRLWIAATIAATVLFAASVLMAVHARKPQEPRVDLVVVTNRDIGAPPVPNVRPAPPPAPPVDVKPEPPAPAPAAAPPPVKPPAPRKPKPTDPRKDPVLPPSLLVPDPGVVALPAPQTLAPSVPYRETVIARIEQVQGEVNVLAGAVRKPATAGQNLTWGQGLETAAFGGSALVKYPDGTRVELWPRTVIWETSDQPGANGPKRILVAAGTVSADVTRQAAGRPMILVSTHGEAKILGAGFKLIVEPESMRLEMREGKIQVTRKEDQASVEVGAGFYVVVGKGIPLVVKPIPAPAPDSPAKGSRSR